MTPQNPAPGASADRRTFPPSRFRKPLAALLVMLALNMPSVAQVPDLTAGGVPTTTKNLNLGPTGAHGWLYHEGVDSSASRQILVQSVAAGSPADGILAVGDVILGVDGTGANPVNFTSDARIALGMAIGDAEARNPATLKLLRWRAGTTTTETITLQTMGAYSATAPYNCAKSAMILEQGLEEVMASQNAGTFGLNVLTLLAGDDPANPANAARQATAQSWALSLMLTQDEIDERLAGYVSRESKVAWKRGHELLVLAEYYLHTGDSQVLPSIEAMSVEVCNGMSVLGTMGHQFTNPEWNGGFNGPYNIGYGVVNSSGLPAYFGLLLARECGITRPELDPAIARATNFFGSYEGYGTIPYGEHAPSRDSHESNGKSGLTALAMSVAGGRPDTAKYFSKMATAAASEREAGHCGAFFNYLWAPLGANVGGEEAAASHFSRIAWRLDLNRRWDGGFDYDCWYHYTTGGPQYPGVNQFWASTPMLLTYAMPLRRLTITGKDQDASLHLSTSEIDEAAFADTYDATTRTTAELVADLGLWSPKVQGLAGQELAARTAEHGTVIPQLIAIANNTSAGEQRVGACFALGKIGNGSAAADLAVLLTDSDERVRWAATNAMRYMPKTSQLTHLNTILSAAATTARAFDPLNDVTPLQFAHAEFAYLLFYSGTASGPKGVIEGNQLNGVDRNLLYPAIEAVAATPLGHARGCVSGTFRNLTQADVEAVAGAIVDTVREPAPADKMFKDGVRTAGLEILQTYNIAEGVALAGDLVLDYNFGDKNPTLDVLALYAGSSMLVNPDPDIIGVCNYLVHAKPGQATDAQEVLDAIAADVSPVAPVPFKSIQSVTAQNPTLQLPAVFTGLDVVAYDHAQGDATYTWRKVYGAGQVTFVPNGSAGAKNTTVVFDGNPGQYLFEVTMSDSRGLTEEVATVAVTLNDTGGGLPTNNPPTATAQSPTIPMSTPTPIILSGTDPEGLDLNFAITSGPSNGTLSGTPPHLVYSADIGYTGADSFTFEVTDSEGQTDSAVVSLTVDTNPVLQTAVYEPFDYPAGVLVGQSGTTEVGLDGTWHAQAGKTTVVAGSLTYGNLATAGNSFNTSTGTNWGAARAINPSALSGSGLLNDGSTIWMSAVVGYAPGANYTNANLRVALANDRFHDWTSPQFIVNDGSQIGSGVGFSMYRHEGINGRVVATQFRDQASLVNNNASIFGTWEDDGALIAQSSHKLIVCRITWASDPSQPDLIEIFQPLDDDLALPSAPISVLSAVLDQSSYDTLAFNVGDKVILDEIRIGSNYHSVLAGTEPLVTDVTAPTPNPVGFHTPPTAVGNTAVTMEAVPAYDPNGVEYYFTCTAGGGNDSGWQASTSYTDTGLTPGVQYSYTVTARDLSPAQNATAPSAAASVSIPTTLNVPNLTGMNQATAEAVITTYGFTVGNNTSSSNDLVPAGIVISQNPMGAAAVGSPVNLVISLGPDNDLTPPNPNPMSFAVAPHPTGVTSIAMTATTAYDVSGVEYYFTCASGGGADSGWQDSPNFEATGLQPGTTYSYRVTARDKSVNGNQTSPSPAAAATTDPALVLFGGYDGTNATHEPKQDPSAVGTVTVTLTGNPSQPFNTIIPFQANTPLWGTTDLNPDADVASVYPAKTAVAISDAQCTLQFVVTNTHSINDVTLDKLHWISRRDGTNSPTSVTIAYASGDLEETDGTNANVSLGAVGDTSFDYDLSALLTSDLTLAPGESATFTWTTNSHNARLRLDNLAFSGFVIAVPVNNAPAWVSNPVNETDATVNAAYSATLADDASDAEIWDILEYAKVSGPAWLDIAADGTLSGTPTNADVGANAFTVSVTDNNSPAVETTLNITVNGPAPTVIPLTSFDPATFFNGGMMAGIDFDVDSNGAAGFQATTQNGFLSVPAGGAGGDYNVTHNGITFDINTTNNNLGGQHRWRGNAVAGDLMNDFEQFFGRSATTGNGVTSVVTLSGLTPNADYEVSFFCYNVGAGQGPLSFHHGTTTSDPLITTFTPTGNQNNYSTWVPGITFGMNSGASGTIAVTIYAPEYPSGLNWDSRLTLNGISVVDPSAPANSAPVWAANPVNEADASEDAPYTATLADNASDADPGDILAFAKVSGPAWLTVAGNGTLSGTPTIADVGNNVFTVSVTDDVIATPVEATLAITVNAAETTAIADFVDDFPVANGAGPQFDGSEVPSPGWNYLWNPLGLLADSANYQPLVPNTVDVGGNSADDEGLFTNDGSIAFNSVGQGDFQYGRIGVGSSHPGNIFDRRAIFAYTIQSGEAGSVYITHSSLQKAILSGDGIDLDVYVNDTLIPALSIDGFNSTTATSFDGALGVLGVGDTVYVTVGNNGSASQDAFVIDFTLDCALVIDSEPPTPSPMGWASVPAADGMDSVTMTAATASDPSGVEYYFAETTGNPGGSDSGWQDSPTYTDSGLDPDTTYTYSVTARDESADQNQTTASSPASATTDPAPVGAGVIAWSVFDSTGALSEISQDGTLVEARSGGSLSEDFLVAGINFVGGQMLDAQSHYDTIGGRLQSTEDTGFTNMLREVARQGSPGLTGITFTGLTVGKQYQIQIWAGDKFAGTAGDHGLVLGDGTGAPLTAANPTVLYEITPEGNNTHGQYAIGTFVADSGSMTFALQRFANLLTSGSAASNTQVNGVQLRDLGVFVPDTTAPTLASGDIVDDQGGANVTENNPVTYTLTFSEDMDEATVDAADFSNAGTATVTIGSVTESSPGVFSVETTPTSTGTLQLQVSAGAVLNDAAGNPLDTSSAIADNTVITVDQALVTVPDVVGMPQATAEANIVASQLTVGSTTQEYSTTVPAGDVISQGLTAGSAVAVNSGVDLVVSLGIDMSPKLVRTTVSSVSNTSWTTVSLGNTYNSPVIVATPIYPPGVTVPVATRITNVTSTGFDLKIDRADGLTAAVSIDVSVVVVDEGVYTQAADGVKMEAVKYTSTVTARKGSWVAEARNFQNSYTNPVVVGQVMSANDAGWSVFWSMGSSSSNPVNATNLNVGKHVGEDPDTTRADETIGYIVIESGSGTVSGVAYEAALGADSVRGFGDSSNPYTYNLSGNLASASSAAASVSGMDGVDGSWAVLSGSPALTTASIRLHACEDQLGDSEQNHTHTQVGYIVFE